MSHYQKRFYRDFHNSSLLKSYQVTTDQSDLYIASSNISEDTAKTALNTARNLIERYIRKYPEFLTSLQPISSRSIAPPVSWMLNASKICTVGPMAAVAGAVSRYVGEALLAENQEVIVENGGDIFISSKSPRKILIYAGDSPVSMKIALEIPKGTHGVCTSAGKVGPSLSFGQADAAIALADDCALADAAATRLGNLINSEDDMENAVKQITALPGIKGAVAILGDKIAAKGEIKLTGV